MLTFSPFNLAVSGNCRIVEGAQPGDRVGTPTFNDRHQRHWSCTANENCNYDVHVIANRISDSGRNRTSIPTPGTAYVSVRATGEQSKPLVLVFNSYRPVRWIVSVPQGVVIERVVLVSSIKSFVIIIL